MDARAFNELRDDELRGDIWVSNSVTGPDAIVSFRHQSAGISRPLRLRKSNPDVVRLDQANVPL